MAIHWLTDLATVLKNGGVPVHEVNGWQSRCFVDPTGTTKWPGYETGLPNHIMVHHTASNPLTDGQADVNYILYGASWGGPISNLYLDRKGVWWVIAAGRTATNGAGKDTWGGGVPGDMMNMYAISIEAANKGTGEPWPKIQTDSYVKGVAALCRGYGISVNHVRAHHEWAPARKIDPAGPSPWATGTNKWLMDAFRADVARLVNVPPTPPTTSNRVMAPIPVLAAGAVNNVTEVKKLQGQCNFWGWHDLSGHVLVVDGIYGPMTTQACAKMQTALKLTATGVYDKPTASALQSFLDSMSALGK